MQLTIFSALIQLALGSPIRATGGSESPGALSGNVIQVPVNLPVNACGNTVSVIGLLNPTFGNTCNNSSHDLDSTNGAEVTVDAPVAADVAAADDSVDPFTEASAEELATI